jgi:serine/threonine kinase PknH
MEPLTSDDPVEIGGFRLRARLGAGGMGRVYLASTPGGRRVALKVVRPELGDDPDFRSRFRQEIEAAQRVRGLYTAELLSADPAATPPWLVTAYVPGPSLQQAVAEHGPMPADTVILLMAGVAEALQAIHGAGVVHRDLKPSNVLLAPDGPRVIDFGIARAAEATNLTQSGVAVGSPQFMAPEQIRGLPITPAVDVFALGAVAAFALLGRPPFGEGHVAALMHRVLNQSPDLNGCAGPLRTLIERCLAKNAADRPGPAEIIESCRIQAAGNLGDFGDSWLPPAVAAAAARAPVTPGSPGSVPSPPPNGVTQAPGGAPAGSAPAGSGRVPFPASGPGRTTPPGGGSTAARNTPRPRAADPGGPTGPVGSAGLAGPGGPGGPGGPAWPGTWPPVPSSLTTAARLMQIGGALSALGALIGLASVHALEVIAAQQQSPRGAVGAAVAILLIHGIAGTALWLWLARETKRGLRRARAWATAVFLIATVSGIGIDANAPSTGLTQAFGGIEWVIGLCAVIMLWNRPSRAYYAAQRPPAPAYPLPASPGPRPSPSLRPRQVPPGQPNTRQDWPARPPSRASGPRPSQPSQADRPGQRR